MQLGLIELRLQPVEFWALTPAEFMLMLGVDGNSTHMSRNAFAALAARFPDEKEE